MADQDDPLTGICDQLADYLPVLARLTPEPDGAPFAAPGKTGRAPAAPLPGNPQAFYAYTGIHAAVRWAERILLYALGASERAARGGSDGNTVKALADVLPRLAAGVDDDTYRMVITELARRLNDALAVPAIDEAQLWRWLGKTRKCPCCGTYQLAVALDARGRPTGHVECHKWDCHDGNGYRPAAQVCADGLVWADGTVEAGIGEAA